VWDDYLALGGLEIGNSARAYGYATTADCPVAWLRDPEWDGAAEALGDLPYDFANIASAPWYDPDSDDLSRRFLGVYPLSLNNLRDSMRTATITQRTTDGGRIGGRRHAAREVRVQAWLTAQGSDALEYGMTWLSAALAAGGCGQHNSRCGVADMAFFTAAPPARGEVPDFSEWAETRRNLATEPQPVSLSQQDGKMKIDGGRWFGSGGATGTYSVVTDATDGPLPEITSYARKTWSVVGTGSGDLGFSLSKGNANTTATTGVPVVVGHTYTLSGWIRASADYGVDSSQGAQMQVWFHAADGTYVSSNNTGRFNLVADEWARVSLTFTIPAGVATFGAVLDIDGGAIPAVGFTLDGTGLLLEDSPNLGDYFDGSSVSATYARAEWLGAVGQSQSIYETRHDIMRPQTDDEYAATLAPLRRFVHDVDTISGPFTVDERESSDGRHIGRLVEFTIGAEDPFVYAVTREVPLTPTLPTVVQDTPYNLTPNPSAELEDGTILVGTNFSTNPSVEVDATGWTAFSTGVTPAATGARSTELAADGVASYKVSVTATNSGSAAQLLAYQDVSLAATGGVPVSATIWAAALVTAGTAVLGAMTGKVEWRNGSGTLLATTPLSAGDVAGAAMSAKSMDQPSGATSARVIALATVTSWSVGAQLALYADALAVTVP